MGMLRQDAWKIIQDGFSATENRLFESLMSSGNGRMGMRGNHEEAYGGDTLKGTYVAGVYYPDKTRVGWWKNGYPEYFAKVLNAVDIIGIRVFLDSEPVDLASCRFRDYVRELDMQHSVLRRSFTLIAADGAEFAFAVERFISYAQPDLGAIRYSVTALSRPAEIRFEPFLNGDVRNEDANYGDKFWEFVSSTADPQAFAVTMRTCKTRFTVSAAASWLLTGTAPRDIEAFTERDGELQGVAVTAFAQPHQAVTLEKYVAVLSDRYEAADTLETAALRAVIAARDAGYDSLFAAHDAKWADIWRLGDIVVEGDVPAQQGVRFNIYQLNCTYSGDDARLNIGPKGFTGEKYGGSTYWDTEAYCLYFYLGTRRPEIARNLLVYRHNQLEKAKENSRKLGTAGALYPMVTINGEECHNEWEITFEEIHRNGAIAHAIKLYADYTGDHTYRVGDGLDVLWEIGRYWVSRASHQKAKDQYMILGVTGPNEYENNVSNNWYTNLMAQWCLSYAADTLALAKAEYPEQHAAAVARLGITDGEIARFRDVASKMYLPEDKELGIFLQQDGYLDKEQVLVSELDPADLPLNKKWSWDRILRSCFIKQADVLQGMWFLGDRFTTEQKTRNFDFYEPRTVHESSLSPCVYSIIAAEIDRGEKAYELYLRTARLDLDNYNHDTDDGLHITSMAGSWMSIIHGFGGLRVRDGRLSLTPFKPAAWTRYAFHLVFRDRLLKITIDDAGTRVALVEGDALDIEVSGQIIRLMPGTESVIA